MTNEEFERIKAAEKEKLRAQRRLRALQTNARASHRVQQALAQMTTRAAGLLRESAALTERLAEQIARGEARLEVALDAASDAAADAHHEKEQRRARAEALVRQFKAQQMAHSGGAPSSTEKTMGPPADRPDAPASTADEPSVQKTIGRIDASDA
ncbi:hypothetical protein [Salisaeta longa]|uniref:hypothetical protein n=1 Tax=Salisaeta longa TaxID=503170 RepID=UPI0003B76B41|nr:hypothetical protein [Salisaeta longa]